MEFPSLTWTTVGTNWIEKMHQFSFPPIGEIVTNLSIFLNWLKVEFYVLKFIYLHAC